MKLVAVCTTVGQADDAKHLADAAVERGLAACVHIDAIASVYRWQGALQHDTEQRLTFKTTDAAAPALRALVLELHPYELPALYSFDVDEASAAYAAWVHEQTSPPAPPPCP
ncbi:MAG: divalent-cation tolerance protein CutA [Rubrivivax sp.]|nr:divalent-cation tolerance protein CutA [Rubrivivax sp.]